MRVTLLGSGSRGNATLVEAGDTRLLVDAGVPLATLRERAAEVGGLPDDVTAVLVSHAHSDHAGHAGACARALGADVHATDATHRRLTLPPGVGAAALRPGETRRIGDLDVLAVPVPHDAPQVAFVLRGEHGSVAIATDLGRVTPRLVEHVRGCRIVMIEANHCRRMLANGPYPESLRARVRGGRGHLSNEQAASLLSRLDRRTEAVVLLHLSESNNSPQRAREVASRALRRLPEVRLEVASPCRPLVLEASPPAQLELGLA